MNDKQQAITKLLKPLIKECIKEVLFESGILSGIVAEVAKGMLPSTTLIQEQLQPQPQPQIIYVQAPASVPLVQEQTFVQPDSRFKQILNRVEEDSKSKRNITQDKINEARKKLNEGIHQKYEKENKQKPFNGVDVFEGVQPLKEGTRKVSLPRYMQNIDPEDPGVDLTSFGNLFKKTN